MKANYSYLSDGTKASVLNASGAGYDYNGIFTYSHASGGARTLESVAFGARRYDRTAWTSIDPLAEKYYNVSPYAYCAGNPVSFVDSEGSEIRIIIGEGENRQQLSYQNGQLYQMDGTEYCGDDHFATIVLATLNNLHAMSDPNINNVLNTIEKSRQKHYIELHPFSDKDDHVVPISEYGYSLANSGIPIDTHILLKLNNTPIENNLSVTNETTLGHE